MSRLVAVRSQPRFEQQGSRCLSRVVPPEIIDYIINNYIHDDRVTLRRCSLVARNWVPSSRHHLYKNIYLSPKTFPGFLELLQSIHCTIHLFARHLHIYYPQDIDWVMKSVLKPNAFAAVTSLTLSTSSWSDIGADAVADLTSCLPGVTDLSVRGVVADGLYRIAIMTREFYYLKHLFLSGYATSMNKMVPPLPPPMLAHLLVLNLKLGERSSDEVLRWIMSMETVPPLHTIHISPAAKKQLPVIGNLVGKLEKSLQCLEVGFCTGLNRAATDFFGLGISLRRHTSLRSITFDCNHLCSFGHRSWTCQRGLQIPIILPQLASPNLESIYLKFGLIHDFDDQVWIDLDRILQRPQFSKLKRVVFQGSDSRRHVLRVRTYMEMCDARGVLDFEEVEILLNDVF